MLRIFQRVIAVATGFLFVGGHTNTLTLDGFGNLWIGDDTSDGTVNFTGRLWRVPVALLRMLFRETLKSQQTSIVSVTRM